jgi:hypothetical protein
MVGRPGRKPWRHRLGPRSVDLKSGRSAVRPRPWPPSRGFACSASLRSARLRVMVGVFRGSNPQTPTPGGLRPLDPRRWARRTVGCSSGLRGMPGVNVRALLLCWRSPSLLARPVEQGRGRRRGARAGLIGISARSRVRSSLSLDQVARDPGADRVIRCIGCSWSRRRPSAPDTGRSARRSRADGRD